MSDQIPTPGIPGSDQSHDSPSPTSPSIALKSTRLDGVYKHRLRIFAVLLILGFVDGLVAIAANVLLFIESGSWQMLAVPVGIVAAWVFLFTAYRRARLGKFDQAAYLSLAGVFLGLGIGELFHAGITYPLALVGGGALLLVATLTLPGRGWVWLLCEALYAAYLWVVNFLDPLASLGGRLPVAAAIPIQATLITVGLSLLGVFAWLVYRSLRTGPIRTRLLVAFVLLGLLPALLVGALSSLLSADRVRTQVLDHLESVAALKQAEVNAWADALLTNLLLAMPSVDGMDTTQVVLAGPEAVDENTYQLASLREFNRLKLIITRGRIFDELFLVDPRGLILLSTDPSHQGLNEYGYPYFDAGLLTPYVSSQYLYQPTRQRIIVAAAPLKAVATGEVIGLLAGRVDLERLQEIMSTSPGLGETGETYLVGRRDLRLLTASRYPGYLAGETYPLFSDGIQNAALGTSGQSAYTNYAGVPVFGAYRYLPDIDMILIAEQARAEALTGLTESILLNAGITLLIVLLAIFGALMVTRSISAPIGALAQVAEQIAVGDSAAKVVLPAQVDGFDPEVYPGNAPDEIAVLAGSFNRMTTALRQALAGLEDQVAQRTVALEQRTRYLQAAAEVSRAAASLLDPGQLIHQVVELIRQRFQLYYVGLFIVDEPGEWALLRAGTGEPGERMLARGHRIKVGTGMIGWSITNSQSRIALHAELDDARLANPFLPHTRSEAAIPLRSRGRVIGALTVQSDQPEAFDEATVAVFETMADQVGVALDNARLFTESQQAYESLTRAYGEQTRLGWSKRLTSQPVRGYRSDSSGNVVREDLWLPETALVYQKGEVLAGQLSDGQVQAGDPSQPGLSTPQSGERFLGVPVRVRDQIIGVIHGYKPADEGVWRPDEIEFMKDVADIVGLTLENARLYEDTQRRAESERVIAEVSTRIRESLDVDTVMQTAVVELQRALGLRDITIRLGDFHEQ
jgi:GAF domain-containing protein/HAMP domain-containing protein